MRPLAGVKVLLGITAGIAAYKSAYLTRLLVKAGADVRVIMTPDSTAFIGPVTLATLSGNPVHINFFDASNGEWANHVELSLWADMLLIAPLTANTMGKMVQGLADNLLLASFLSAKCPIAISPAMDLDMWKHPSTFSNLETLRKRGVHVIEPESGELASGLIGKGRMAEPETIADFLENYFARKNQPLYGKQVLITAGPTYEELDPVRFIGNYSTGKMGFSLADACFEAGAEVVVVHGPVSLNTRELPYSTVKVTSAVEMLEACKAHQEASDFIIAAAAVADYTPVERSETKIKKEDLSGDEMTITLKRNPDILATMSANKRNNQIIGGFALETNNEVENAKKKLEKKQLDFIVLNSLADKGAGFATDTNKISIIDKRNNLTKFELKSKKEAARDIVRHIIELSHA